MSYGCYDRFNESYVDRCKPPCGCNNNSWGNSWIWIAIIIIILLVIWCD